MLYRYQTATGTNSWVKILPKLTDNYNKTIHRSLGLHQIVKPKQEFKVGDRVRLRIRENNKLEKAKRYFTEEVYKINRVINGNKRKLTEYKLESVRGTFNASDLLLSNVVNLPAAIMRSTNYTSPLSIPAQFEVDQLLANRNLRPTPARHNEYIVERILNTRIYLYRRQYLVKWSGYEDPTWQDESDLEGGQQLVNAFLKERTLVYVLI